MAGIAENVVDGAAFHDLALVDDHDLVGQIGDDAEIMGDQQHRQAELLAQILDQFQNLRLHRNVQRRRRFIGDDEAGPAHQCHGDHRPLPEPARKLKRVKPHGVGRIGESNQAEHPFGMLQAFLATDVPMQEKRLADLVADGMQVRKGRHGVLEDHRNIPAAESAHFLAFGVQFGEVDRFSPVIRLVKQDFAAGNPGLGRQQPHDRLGGDRFPRTRLADQGDDRPRTNGEREIYDRVNDATGDFKIDLQVIDIQKVGHGLSGAPKI